MSWTGEWIRRCRMLLRRKQFDDEMAEEMRLHRELRKDEFVAGGAEAEEAGYAAARQFGNEMLVRERGRDAWGWRWLEEFLQDLHFGGRMLVKNPGYACVAILTLVLGIGANTAIFSAVNSVLLRPLPYREPGRLVWADEYWPILKSSMVPNPEYTNWKLQNHTFEQLAAYGGIDEQTLHAAGRAERIKTIAVTANMLQVLGVQPTLGRDFVEADDKPKGNPVAILSNECWSTRFGEDKNIAGKTLNLDNVSYTIIGILPAGFRFPDGQESPQIYRPFQLPVAVDWGTRSLVLTRVIGRLQPGVSLTEARTELAGITEQAHSEMPAAFVHMRDGLRVQVIKLHEKLVGDVRPALFLLFASVGIVLLIGCVNVANLQLARAMNRQKEMAIRTAIGAGRPRLLRQLLTEGILVALLGGVGGFLLAIGGVRLLRNYAPETLLPVGTISVNLGGLLFAFMLSVVTALAFGMVPALRGSKIEVNVGLQDGKNTILGSYGQGTLRNLLVVAELALAVVLLVASGLLLRSFVLLSNVEIGFDPHNLLVANVALSEAKYGQPEDRKAFFDEALRRIHIAGVQSAALTTSLPLTDFRMRAGLVIEGQPERPAGANPSVPLEYISPDYFKTLRIPLLAGRTLEERDGKTKEQVTVLNEEFVRRYFANVDPIGKRIYFGTRAAPPISIVGVVGSVKHEGLAQDTEPQMYLPFEQNNSTVATVVVRTDADPRGMASAVREQMNAVDAEQPVFDISTMERRVSDALTGPRFNTTLLGLFGLAALTLAGVGVFGVIAYSVAQRTHEIGVRMALGASRQDVVRLVMKQGLVATIVGLILGFGGTLVTGRYLSRLLYGVRPEDPLTLSGVLLILGGVALVASYIPARRAMRVDPVVALRYE